MSIIDRQRIAAVRELEKLGYSFTLSRGWTPPPDTTGTQALQLAAEADAMHVLLVQRADKLEGCTKGSEEAIELERIADAAEAYEAKRWPDGKELGDKG
jgi:hypothetical protein